MNSTADRNNGRILKNYIYAKISLHKLAKILIEDWQIADRQRFPSVYKLFSLNCPRYVFCGHLHTCKDKYLKLDNTEIYNVSILDNNYKEIYKPLYLDI